MSIKIIDSPSPSQNERPSGAKIRLVVIHGTVGTDAGDLAFLKAGGAKGNPVSYHYLILRNGDIHRLVRPERRAWACGDSEWGGVKGVNDFSISIGLSNLNDGKRYTEAQYRAAGQLLAIFAREYGIQMDQVVGHQHVSPGRKTDPWPVFEWGRLFRERENAMNG